MDRRDDRITKTGQRMNMLRHAMFMTVLLCAAEVSAADVVLDQYYEGPDDGWGAVDNRLTRAQTFTVGVDGVLDSLDVHVVRSTNTFESLVVEIRTTTDEVPSENGALFSTIVSPNGLAPAGVQSWVSVDVSDSGIQVTTGDMLAIVLISDAMYGVGNEERYGWSNRHQSGQYDGGAAWFSLFGAPFELYTDSRGGSFDHLFRTYVVVPVPASTLPVICSVCSSRRKRAI